MPNTSPDAISFNLHQPPLHCAAVLFWSVRTCNSLLSDHELFSAWVKLHRAVECVEAHFVEHVWIGFLLGNPDYADLSSDSKYVTRLRYDCIQPGHRGRGRFRLIYRKWRAKNGWEALMGDHSHGPKVSSQLSKRFEALLQTLRDRLVEAQTVARNETRLILPRPPFQSAALRRLYRASVLKQRRQRPSH